MQRIASDWLGGVFRSDMVSMSGAIWVEFQENGESGSTRTADGVEAVPPDNTVVARMELIADSLRLSRVRRMY